MLEAINLCGLFMNAPVLAQIVTKSGKKEIIGDYTFIKIIDVNKAKVVDSKTFQGNNETSSYSLGGAGFGGGFGLVGGLSNIKGTPMEDIVRDVLARVASFSSMKLIETKGVTDVVITNPVVKKS